MVWRHELTDVRWWAIESRLAVEGRSGGQGRSIARWQMVCRTRACTGGAVPGLPERYGPWQTVYERYRRWSADGAWQRIL
ncbi:transposase [Streptomyces albofaciens]|uniref:transposase n=1 Tax=Streptomyces albofaciens TaxID=66866 RepID=UPI003CC6E489